MKKAVSLVLALTLCVALAVPAFAQTDLVDTDYGTYTFDFGNATISDISLPIAGVDPATFEAFPVATKFKSVDLKLGDSFEFTNGSNDRRGVGFAVFGKSAADMGCYHIATFYGYGVDVDAGTQTTIKVPTMKEICDISFKSATYKALAEYAYLKIYVAVEGFEDTDAYYIPLNTAEFNAANPNAPAQTTPPATTTEKPAATEKLEVIPTNQKLTVNGAEKKTEIYNINGANYFKLRDMAALLNGTGSQFSVDFDSARNTVVIQTGAAYAAIGGELATGKDNSASTVVSPQSVEIDGAKVELTAYNIGGANFFKLRDLGAALGFDVDYDEATATMLVKSK